MKIILASASPRRKQLLDQIGWEFEVMASDMEERVTKTKPREVVEELSRQKAEAVLASLPESCEDLLVIGADTIVALDDRILGKPKDFQSAEEMLQMLQGRSHYVYTGVTLCLRRQSIQKMAVSGKIPEVKIDTFSEATKVTFYPMSKAEIHNYVSSGDPLDKAGAYGIQGLCARYISGIKGDYNNVVGLPIGRLYQEFKKICGGGGYCSMKKAVLFDLDGTLSDSIASIKYCADQAIAPFGYGPYTIEQYKYFVGDGSANLIKRCLKAGGDEYLIHFEEAFTRYQRIFRKDCMYQVKPYKGIPQLIKTLKEQGVRIAVLSNKPHEETIYVIETLFGKETFDIIQGQKPDVAIKPSPDGVFEIVKQLGLTCSDILYLGDTSTDMQTGKNAGAFTIGALWGFRERKELEEHHADALIEHPMELLAYLDA